MSLLRLLWREGNEKRKLWWCGLEGPRWERKVVEGERKMTGKVVLTWSGFKSECRLFGCDNDERDL
jgi:hypothetical protein